MNIDGLNFSNGFKGGNVFNFGKLKNFLGEIFELIFYQEGNEWKHKLLRFEISKNSSDNVFD